ncbi:MAG: SH3 domain-containing protein, partial [bacterium]|nr:SH3 domain-containing protein [bacterium]
MTKNKTCITKSFYFFLTLSLAALYSTTLWSAPRKSDQASPGHVIIEIKKAEIRSAPNPASTILEIAFKGEIFKVLHELPDWYLIQLSSGKEGYLSRKYARVKILDTSKKAHPIVSKQVKKETMDNYVLIISSGSFIRTSPKADSKIIAQAKVDNAFKLSKKVSTSWYEIILSNGKKSYVPAAITKIITSADLVKLKAQRKTAVVPKPKTQPQPEPQPKPVVISQPQPQQMVPVEVPQQLYAVAMKNDIILRQEPNISSKIMVTAKQGDHYKINSQEGIWCSISLPDSQQAFVLSKVIRIVKESELAAAVTEATKAARQIKLKTVSVTDKSAKLRAKASDASKVIITASQGTVFKLVWVYKDWYEVLTSSGTAFISDKSAKLVNEEETEAETPVAPVTETPVPAPPAPVQPTPEEPVIIPPVPAPVEEKPAVETKPETEIKPIMEKPAVQDEDAWLRDKYILVTTNMVNVRETADKKSRILARANTDTTYKLLARHKGWYEIFLPPDQNAFIAVSLAEIITEADVLAGPNKFEETRKERQAAELKAKQLRAAEALAKRKETERLAAEAKARKLAEEKSRKEEAFKAKLENEKKVKEDSERRANEVKAKEQEWLKDKYVLITVKKAVLQKAPSIKGKIIATVNIDDTYKLVSRAKDWYELNFSTGTAYLNHNLGTILSETALAEHKQKVAEEKARKEEELKAKLDNERKVKEESDRRAKEAAELKAKQEAERKAKLEAEKAKEQEWLKDKYAFISKKNINLRKAPVKTAPVIAQTKTGESFKIVSRTKEWYEVSLTTGTAFIASSLAEVLTDKELETKRTFEKESAEAKAQQRREAQELKERQEAEAKALDELWCKDKYIVIMADNANLRAEPALKAKILSSAKKSDIFKLLSRGKEWYEIFLPPDQNAFVSIGLVDILTEGEVESRIKKEQEPILRKQRAAEALAKRQEAERLAAEAKAKKEEEEKALKLRAAEELKARQKAELKARQENEKKIKEEADLRAKEAAEQKAKEEAELKAKEIEWLKDKYILVEKKAAFLPAPNKKAAPSGTALADTSFKIVTRTNEWYGVDTSSGTAFIPIDKVKLMTEQELNAYRQQQELALQEKLKKETEEKARKETELKAKLEAERKAKEEMELKERQAAEEKARQEAEAKAKIESEVLNKYILVQVDNANLRSAPKKSSPIITRAKEGESFKLVWIESDDDNTRWYQVNVPSGQQTIKAYIHSSLAKPVTKDELDKITRSGQPIAILPPVTTAALEPAIIEPLPPATTETAEQKAKAESDAKMLAYIEDKYVLILIDNTNIRTAPDKSAALITKARIDEAFKITWIKKDRANTPWYQVSLSTGTQLMDGYVISTLTKLITKQQLGEHRFAQEQAAQNKARQEAERKAKLETEQKAKEEKLRLEAEAKVKKAAELKAQQEEKARLEAEAKAKREAELKAKQEAEQKAKEEKERLAREAAELKARQETEAKAKKAAELKAQQEEKSRLEAESRAREQEWLKDKYVVITTNNTNLRQAPYKTASIITKAKTGDVFKLKARGNEWYELLKPPDQVVFVMASLIKVMSESEVQAKAEAERLAKEEKERLEAETKAKQEAERLAKEEAARKAKELRAAAELAKQQEEEQKKREAAELKARQEAEQKARLEAYVRDKYILTTLDSTNLRSAPDKNSTIIAKANNDVSFKVTWISPDKQNVPWYQIAVPSGTSTIQAYVVSTLAKLVTVQELNDHRLTQQKEAEEKARLAREAAELKAKQEAELQAKQEAERLAKEEAARKAKELRAAAELAKQQEEEQKKREAAELKARQEAERKSKLEAEKAQEEEWLKDKYVLVQYKDANIRKIANKNADIVQKAQLGQDFKI